MQNNKTKTGKLFKIGENDSAGESNDEDNSQSIES
jgi:hypothetical protein